MKIGVLAVQGAFIEHKNVIEQLGVECIELRQKKDLKNIDGIILPGGESTVQGQLLHRLDMFEIIRNEITKGIPTLATCAGLILLANKIKGQDATHLATLPVTVKRNAYGRQLGSFVTRVNVGHITNFPEIFIRAPYITDVDPTVDVLSTVDDKIVAVKYKNQIGLSFHPEMTEDYRIHEDFITAI